MSDEAPVRNGSLVRQNLGSLQAFGIVIHWFGSHHRIFWSDGYFAPTTDMGTIRRDVKSGILVVEER